METHEKIMFQKGTIKIMKEAIKATKKKHKFKTPRIQKLPNWNYLYIPKEAVETLTNEYKKRIEEY